jgi:transposase
MPRRYTVKLTEQDRESLEESLRQGGLSFRQVRRARTLLMVDEGESDEAIAEALETHRSNIERTRKTFFTGGLAAALGERPRSGRPAKLDGKGEALIVALACSQAPEGQARWTLRQLGNRLVGLEVVETISHETVRRILKKTRVANLACPPALPIGADK